jgi:NAD(P)-dependent dehydrogenase (short-subunit alcohol dehydrogenase family)
LAASLVGQTVVVVGGGSGIGLATAVAAEAAGAHVAVITRQVAGLDRVIGAAPAAARYEADVMNEAALSSVAHAIGHVDHVYVSAGTTRLGSLMDDDSVADQVHALRVRLEGGAHVLRAFHPVLRGDGSFTLTGGVSSDRPVKGSWVSSVGTSAAEQFARSMALEMAPLRVNAVAPGWTDTPMWDAVLGTAKDGVLADAARTLLTRRLVRPDEVAAAVLFLMTCESVTGETVHIDGGSRLT